MRVIPTKEDEKKALNHEWTKRVCFTYGLSRVLTERLGVTVVCYGGTPIMPICEYYTKEELSHASDTR